MSPLHKYWGTCSPCSIEIDPPARACRATSPTSLPKMPRAYLIGRSAAVYSAARLSVCRVVLQTPPARHARPVADSLARMSRGCYEAVARKLLPWNFSNTQQFLHADYMRCSFCSSINHFTPGRGAKYCDGPRCA